MIVALALAVALGGLVAGWAGLATGLAVAVPAFWRPRAAAAAAAGLVAATGVATLVEVPLTAARISAFSAEHDVANRLGRAAGVTLLVAVAAAAVRERSPAPTAPAPVRRRRARYRPEVAWFRAFGARESVVVALAGAASALVLVSMGDGSGSAWAFPVAGCGVAVAAAGGTLGRRARRRRDATVGGDKHADRDGYAHVARRADPGILPGCRGSARGPAPAETGWKPDTRGRGRA